MNPKLLGALIGLAVGVVWLLLGFWQAVIIGILALVGWLVGKAVEEEMEVADMLDAAGRFLTRQARRRR